MKKAILGVIIGTAIGFTSNTIVPALASTPKASSYCTKAELNKTAHYTIKSGQQRTVKCTRVVTTKTIWKLVK
jgi:hypothetical protein